MWPYFISLVMAIPFDDVMQRVSDCLWGNDDSCALFLPLSMDTFVARVKWLWNMTIVAFEELVIWNRKALPIDTAWLLRTDEDTIVNLIREHRQATLRASAVVCVVSALYAGFTPASSPFARSKSIGMRYLIYRAIVFALVIISFSAGLLFIFAWNLEELPEPWYWRWLQIIPKF
ncbi:hypothetical protein B0H19DRAFT_1140917 [Mycena capillaripes]|nr:hypothetical protein B0H19DRAFT_1140917 [Mycena capillaripes]